MPLMLELHTCMTLCLSHWSSTLVRCLASEWIMATVYQDCKVHEGATQSSAYRERTEVEGESRTICTEVSM